MSQTEITKGASLSECRLYRYALWRTWGENSQHVMFIGLNPSTADESVDDPTIRRCIGFAKAWGFDGIYMLNLFAFRATDPQNMKGAADPVGPGNDEALAYYRSRCQKVVACWGLPSLGEAWKRRVFRRGWEVRYAIGRTIECFGLVKSGEPKHPLYLPKTAQLEQWWSPEE